MGGLVFRNVTLGFDPHPAAHHLDGGGGSGASPSRIVPAPLGSSVIRTRSLPSFQVNASA